MIPKHIQILEQHGEEIRQHLADKKPHYQLMYKYGFDRYTMRNIILNLNGKWFDRCETNTPQKQAGLIVEDFIANGLQISEITAKYKVHQSYVSRLITKYFKKPSRNLRLKSKV